MSTPQRWLASLRTADRPTPPPTSLQVIQLHNAYPWLTADKFNEANFVNLVAGTGFTRAVSFRVPQGQLGMLTGFFNGVNDLTAWDVCGWQIRVEGAGVMGYDAIRGSLGSPVVMHPMYVPLYSRQLIEIVIRNGGGVDFTHLAAGMTGIVFPDTLPTELAQLAALVPSVKP